MPAICRLGDSGSGHGCFPGRANTQGSSNVFINGLGAHIVGHSWASHGCGACVPHASVLAGGSSTVFVNGQPLGRIGDPIACGSTVVSGSGNVFAG